MKTAYLYHRATGEFTGRCIQGDEAFIATFEDADTAAHIGEIDNRRNRVDTATGKLKPCKPRRPADTDDTAYRWDAAADDWLGEPTDGKLERDAKAKRSALLAASDWVALRASDLGQPIPTAWAQYRAALRDITLQGGYPRLIVWPEAPK